MIWPQDVRWDFIEKEAQELLCQLVRFDTSNPPGNEGVAIDFIAELLKKEGLTPHVVAKVPGRSNLVIRLSGKRAGPALMLDSHVDVVPASGEWKVPPFAGEIRDGYIWGRGTVDMKQMTAMSLATLLFFHRRKLDFAGELVVTVTADEEDGGGELGVRFLTSEHRDLIAADYALGEVGGMNLTVNGVRVYPVQVAEKGLAWIRLTLKGVGGHGSIPRDHSVTREMGRLLKKVSNLHYKGSIHPAAADFLDTLASVNDFPANVGLKLAQKGALGRFVLKHLFPEEIGAPLRAMVGNVIQPTVIRCGDKTNVIPTQADVTLDCRLTPGVDPAAVAEFVRRKVGPSVEVEVLQSQRGMATSYRKDPLFQIIRETVESLDPGAVVTPWLTTGLTNGSTYSKAGIRYFGFTPVMFPATVSFGDLFHAPDERCPVKGLNWGTRTLIEVVARFLEVKGKP